MAAAVLFAGGLVLTNVRWHADTSAPPQTPAEQAAASGEPVEVESDRTEYTQTFANPDGTYTLKEATVPQRAKEASGAWHDIDTTVVRREVGRVMPRRASRFRAVALVLWSIMISGRG